MTTVTWRCPRCDQPIIAVDGYVLDLAPGDKPHGAVTIYGTHAITRDREGQENVLILSGEQLAAARKNGLMLFRRHGATCSGFWPRGS